MNQKSAMSLRLLTAIGLCLLGATGTLAAGDCSSSMTWEPFHFRGTVRSLEALTQLEADPTPANEQIRFIAMIDVDPHFRLESDQPVMLGIRKMTTTPESEYVIGRSYDFDAERLTCSGTFMRLANVRLQERPVVERFEGRLKIGHRYRARARWSPARGLTLRRKLEGPEHQGIELSWTNELEFRPGTKRAVQEVIFEVVSFTLRAGRPVDFSEYAAKVIDVR